MNEVLGGGGMGLVYKARHCFINRTVAIKVLHEHMITSSDVLKRFQLEAQAVSSLDMPNILTIYDFGVSRQGQPYMVMDYLPGVSLEDVLEKERRLTIERSLKIFIQVCAALAHAHKQNIIHRDLKPSNIMLVEAGGTSDFVKIVDFGIAKVLGQAEGDLKHLTRTGEVFGSPLYMSPEQCRGKPLDPRTDMYSLGCVMYRALSGKCLFEGDEVLELFFRQVSEAPRPFSVVCPELAIPGPLEEIIFRTLEKEPSQRFQSMDQLGQVLSEFQNNYGLPGQKLSATAGMLAVSSASEPLESGPNRTDPVITRQTFPPSSNISARNSLEDNSLENRALAAQTLPPSAKDLAETTGLTDKAGLQDSLRRKLVIIGCLVGTAILLAISFWLGRHEAIDEEKQEQKNAAVETSPQGKPPVVMLQQSLPSANKVGASPQPALGPALVKPIDSNHLQKPDDREALGRPGTVHTKEAKTHGLTRPAYGTVQTTEPHGGVTTPTINEQFPAPVGMPSMDGGSAYQTGVAQPNSENAAQIGTAPQPTRNVSHQRSASVTNTSAKSEALTEIVKYEKQSTHRNIVKIKKVLRFLKKSLDE
jgi:serine/threonine protein kinase